MATLSYVPTRKLMELLETADPHCRMQVRVASASRLLLGEDPLRAEVLIDLAREQVSPYKPQPEPGAEKPVPVNAIVLREHANRHTAGLEAVEASAPGRTSGSYWIEIMGQRAACRSLKELLAVGLTNLEKLRPGTLERLTVIKKRTKRIVARDKRQLFDSGHLSEEFSARLTDEWFYGTNNSAGETLSWLQRACECAGLLWGEHVKASIA